MSAWSGDTISGTTASDTNKKNNGTIFGGVTTVPGKVINAFKFDGSTGYVSMGNSSNLNFGTGPFSLVAWFKWDGGGSSVNNIIRKSNYGGGPGSGYWVRIGKDNKTIEFSVGATTQPQGQTLITAPISSGEWHHVVATRDNSDVVKLYVDGQSTGTFLRQASKANSTSESPFTLGAWEDQHSEFFSGLIDEVSVFNIALSASQVQDFFNAGNTDSCPSSSLSPVPSIPLPYPSPNQSQYPQSSGTIPQEYCSSFAAVPKCEYVGPPDSQNYKYCKQCFPDK